MTTLSRLTPLFFCIVANIVFLMLTYSETGAFRITVLHFAVGIIPFILVSVRTIKAFSSDK